MPRGQENEVGGCEFKFRLRLQRRSLGRVYMSLQTFTSTSDTLASNVFPKSSSLARGGRMRDRNLGRDPSIPQPRTVECVHVHACGAPRWSLTDSLRRVSEGLHGPGPPRRSSLSALRPQRASGVHAASAVPLLLSSRYQGTCVRRRNLCMDNVRRDHISDPV